jgi:hypothetical protein
MEWIAEAKEKSQNGLLIIQSIPNLDQRVLNLRLCGSKQAVKL